MSKTYWLVDSIGEGPPNAQDLDCEGDVQGERTFRLEQDQLELRGGLAEQEAQAARTWRQGFGIVRVCAEKHLPKKIGTLLDERIEVEISENGLIHAMRFREGRHADLVECMQGYSSRRPPFATAQRESLLTVQLTIRWGNSDYQIDGCDRLRKSE